MKARTSQALTLLFSISILLQPPGLAQAQQPTQTQKQADDGEVVRITTNLVQIDAVVTDKDGKPVTDLREEDFEIYEDGHPQQITNFSFISNGPAAPADADNKREVAPSKPVQLSAEQVRRTIALVADDICITQVSVASIQGGLKKFVDQQMQPGDLVGIFSVRGGSGALQQFTSDKQQLYRAIKNLKWRPPPIGNFCANAFNAAQADYTVQVPRNVTQGRTTFEDQKSRAQRLNDEFYQEQLSSAGSVGTLRYLVRGLQDLPGRKSVVLFSEGLPVRLGSGSSLVLDSLKKLIDVANRAAVTIYTIDPRGVMDPSYIMAADEVLPDNTESLRQSRRESVIEAYNGLNYLAQQTGGLFRHDANDLSVPLKRMLVDQSGYYLIGYKPTDATFAKGADKFHHIEIKLKRAGLQVRSRSGFFGITTEEARPKARNADSPLYAALASPLTRSDVHTNILSLFGNDARTGSFIRALLHIDARDLKFTDEPNGRKKLVLDVAAVTFGEDNKLVDQFNRTHTIRMSETALNVVLKNGLSYTMDVPVKKPGAYQLRVAVRDGTTQRLGSASQFVQVPDLKKETLALSGIVVAEAKQDAAPAWPPVVSAEDALAPVMSSSELAVRDFQTGTILSYSYFIYNPRLDKQTHQPQLTTKLRLYRDGKLVLDGKEIPFELGQQTDMTRLRDDEMIRINSQVEPGDYTLQVIVTDRLADEKRNTSTQWTDFTVTR